MPLKTVLEDWMYYTVALVLGAVIAFGMGLVIGLVWLAV